MEPSEEENGAGALFNYELKGEWIPKEETAYFVTKNNFDTRGFPEVTEATVGELRE